MDDDFVYLIKGLEVEKIIALLNEGKKPSEEFFGVLNWFIHCHPDPEVLKKIEILMVVILEKNLFEFEYKRLWFQEDLIKLRSNIKISQELQDYYSFNHL